MNFTNFLLDHPVVTPSGTSTQLFRLTTADILSSGQDSAFGKLFRSQAPFAIHIVVDDSIINDDRFIVVLEKIFLIVGRENYFILQRKKLVFISFEGDENIPASKLTFKLRSLFANIYIIHLKLSTQQKFQSAINVCVDVDEKVMRHHFEKYMRILIRQGRLLDYDSNYFIISSAPVNLFSLQQALIHELAGTPDLLRLLKEASLEIGSFKEGLELGRNENKALLNAVGFLKQEVKIQYDEKENIHRENANRISKAEERLDEKVREIQNKYAHDYESLPGFYKKIGALLKLVSGRKELAYYLSKKQKNDFFNLLAALPKDKQVEMWYYYEFEILPAWYKKIGKRLIKNK